MKVHITAYSLEQLEAKRQHVSEDQAKVDSATLLYLSQQASRNESWERQPGERLAIALLYCTLVSLFVPVCTGGAWLVEAIVFCNHWRGRHVTFLLRHNLRAGRKWDNK